MNVSKPGSEFPKMMMMMIDFFLMDWLSYRISGACARIPGAGHPCRRGTAGNHPLPWPETARDISPEDEKVSCIPRGRTSADVKACQLGVRTEHILSASSFPSFSSFLFRYHSLCLLSFSPRPLLPSALNTVSTQQYTTYIKRPKPGQYPQIHPQMS